MREIREASFEPPEEIRFGDVVPTSRDALVDADATQGCRLDRDVAKLDSVTATLCGAHERKLPATGKRRFERKAVTRLEQTPPFKNCAPARIDQRCFRNSGDLVGVDDLCGSQVFGAERRLPSAVRSGDDDQSRFQIDETTSRRPSGNSRITFPFST